jgi:hypothetical protein
MVSRQAIWMKKRYAEDSDYRDQQIARSLHAAMLVRFLTSSKAALVMKKRGMEPGAL